MIRSLPHPGRPLGLALVAAIAIAACSTGAATLPAGPSNAPSAASAPPVAASPVQTSTASSPAAGTGMVSIQGFAFHDQALTVKVGAPVTWTNQDGATHTVTFDAGGVDSGRLATHSTFTHAFTTAGSFTYHCAIHTSMTGTVTVTP